MQYVSDTAKNMTNSHKKQRQERQSTDAQVKDAVSTFVISNVTVRCATVLFCERATRSATVICVSSTGSAGLAYTYGPGAKA